MKKQVLTIEQMSHLKGLGINTSDASMAFHCTREDIKTGELKEGFYTTDFNPDSIDDYPVYTVQDLLDKLPRYIQPFKESINETPSSNDRWKLTINTLSDRYWVVSYVRSEPLPEELEEELGAKEYAYHRDDMFMTGAKESLIDALYEMYLKYLFWKNKKF